MKKGCLIPILIVVGVNVVFFGSAMIAGMADGNSSTTSTKSSSSSSTVEKYQPRSEVTIKAETKAEETTAVISKTIETDAVTTEPEPDIPYNKVTNYKIQNSLPHNSVNGYLILAKGETAKIAITASPTNLNLEDFCIDYNKNDLNLKIESQGNNEKNTQSEFIFTVNAYSPGSYDIQIYSKYDSILNPNNYNKQKITVAVLSNEQSKTVYITEYGTKYHYSSSCAGSKAVRTTLYDAVRSGYDPCKKCAH